MNSWWYIQVFCSIGYKGVPVDNSVPFDSDKGIIPNKDGRVLNSELNWQIKAVIYSIVRLQVKENIFQVICSYSRQYASIV